MDEAGVKVLGYKTKKRKEWMKQDTWTNISGRKETKQKFNATRSQRLKDRQKRIYAELNREVKRMAKADLSWRDLQRGLRKQLENRTLRLSVGSQKHSTMMYESIIQMETSSQVKQDNWRAGKNTSILNRPEPTEIAQIPDS